MNKFWIIFSLSLVMLLTACGGKASPVSVSADQGDRVSIASDESFQLPEASPSPVPTVNNDNNESVTPTQVPTPLPPLPPDAWKELPVLPTVSDTARAIYQRGLKMGNDAQAFSKIGDCQNVSSYFLSVFDEPGEFRLGEDYAYLQPTIDYYHGSFSRNSEATKGGYNVAAILQPLRADPKTCNADESPLACELRIHNPSVVIVSLEEGWGSRPAETYNKYMRQVVEYIISEGVVPILATKADNVEGDHSINAAIAQIAYEYDIPLWNFWAAVQPLPDRGLSDDGFHLTFARNFFDDPVRMLNAWPVRNLTALQSLDIVHRGLIENSP